jgi:ribosomal protein S18 acetylase RimI-like enzyme
MPQIEIRPITASDIPLLVEMDHSFKTSHVWQMDRSTGDDELAIRFREIRLPRPVRVEYPRNHRWLSGDLGRWAAVLVSVMEGVPVGYISISENLSPATSWITDLAVSPGDRRQGIASALIFAGQDWSIQRRNRRMVLEMQSKNFAGICLARKLGFDFCGYNDHYYSNQDIALFFAQYLR